jgi:pimeloyl-ACP methyl ester carboxylesterase
MILVSKLQHDKSPEGKTMFNSENNGLATVLCLHSSMSHGGQWRALVNRLENEFNVITPNLIGYGEATNDFACQLRLEHEVAAVMQQIDNIDGPLHLVGHSFGGAVSLRLASMYPERVASLTLYEPVWFSLLFESGISDAETLEIERVQKALASDTHFGQMRGAQEFIDYWAGGDGWSHLSAEQQSRLASLSSKVAAEFTALMAAGPATQELKKLNIPVRLLCGTNTRDTARRISELLAEIVPGVEYHRMPGLAHMAPVTNADDVNPLIVEHILANATDAKAAVA